MANKHDQPDYGGHGNTGKNQPNTAPDTGGSNLNRDLKNLGYNPDDWKPDPQTNAALNDGVERLKNPHDAAKNLSLDDVKTGLSAGKKAADAVDKAVNGEDSKPSNNIDSILRDNNQNALNALNKPANVDDPQSKGDEAKADSNSKNSDQDNNDKSLKDRMGNAWDSLKNLPNQMKNAAGTAKTKLTGSILKAASATGVTMSVKTASIMASLGLAGAPIAGIGGVTYLLSGQNNVLYNDNDACSTQNTGQSVGDILSGLIGGGAAGAWTDQGSQTYKNMVGCWNFFKSKGFSGIQIAGILGNIAQESQFNTGATSGAADLGIVQWTDNTSSSALTEFKNWCSSEHKEPTDLSTQLEYLWEHNHSAQTSNGVKNNHTLISGLMNASSIDAAAELWEVQVEGAGNVMMENRISFGKQIYSMMHGESVKGDKSKLEGLLNGSVTDTALTNASTAEQQNNAQCSGGDADTATSGDVLATAKKLLGYFTYSQSTRTNIAKNGNYQDIKNIDDVNKNGTTDCSGYVWLVLKLAGYKVPDQMWWTGAQWTDATGAHNYLKEVDQKDAKAGDIVIIGGPNGGGDAGHTMILEEDWHGKDTKIINEGGYGDHGPVNESTYYEAVTDMGPVLFARPIKN